MLKQFYCRMTVPSEKREPRATPARTIASGDITHSLPLSSCLFLASRLNPFTAVREPAKNKNHGRSCYLQAV